MLTAPAVTPAPQPITRTDRACRGTSVVRWPSIRWRRMSCGSLEAWILPALWYPRRPFGSRDTATDEWSPSPEYSISPACPCTVAVNRP